MTFADLRNYVFDFLMANPSAAGAGIWSQAEVEQYIRDGELKMFCAIADKHDHFCITSTTLSEVANQTIDTPENCYRIIWLERIAGAGASTQRPFFMQVVDKNFSSVDQARGYWWPYMAGVPTTMPVYYMNHGQKKIELYPTPQISTANSLRLTYIYRPAEMVNDGDRPFQEANGPGGLGRDNLAEFHDIIAKYAIEACLLKEEMYPLADRVKAERLEREGELKNYLGTVNVQMPKFVHQTEDVWED